MVWIVDIHNSSGSLKNQPILLIHKRLCQFDKLDELIQKQVTNFQESKSHDLSFWIHSLAILQFSMSATASTS